MNPERIKRLLKQKENIHLEFKEAGTALPGNLFETICAMLNRDGGDILLGVEDNGNVRGIDDNAVSKMVTDLVNLSNNPQNWIRHLFFFHRYMILPAKRLFISRCRPAHRYIKPGRSFTIAVMMVTLK
ncbi:AlbA family DNA-binding domain-containing protein [Terrimonas sp.]|uniref:AlbA family DNA-binding domain-containing protein n=1 Tax=Terrimonas sp. TaxID=1914338 RepID=UPI00197DA680|nr:ATP-binding protein [Terrimonas sp.]